jgi:hypothetical protein
MKFLKKVLILSHRYVGIVLGLLVIVWFASGIAMMYVGGMPAISAETRRERTPPLDLGAVDLSPAEAVARAREASGARGGGSARLLTVMDRPAYRVGPTTVFADTGEVMPEADLATARKIAGRFVGVGEDRVRHVATLEAVDQWTLSERAALPLLKFEVDDPDRTEVYVEPRTGDVRMLTTARARTLAWIGTIPHWLYFTALRSNQPLWYDIVVWSSGAVTLLAALGLVLGVVQLRKKRPFHLSSAVPYSGWMRWHYLTGAVFGVFTLTWAFSGMLSMEPFAWTNATGLTVPGSVFSGGAADLDDFAAPDPIRWADLLDGRSVKEIDFARIQDAHYYVVRLAPEDGAEERERGRQPYALAGDVDPDRLLVEAASLEVRSGPFTPESLVARLEAAVPEAAIRDWELLQGYDSYYYSRAGQLPLPVLRVRFEDPAETWVYADPEMSQMLGALPRLARLERWLYNGLHSLDFAFWYNSAAWDVGMIVLLLGGLATSTIGLLVGLGRVKRGAFRLANPRS